MVLTYLLTPWTRVLLEKLTGSQLLKNVLAFYGTRRNITAFISARRLSLSWAMSIKSIHPSHFMKIHLNIILPSMSGSSKWFLSLKFPYHNPLYTSALPRNCYMLLPSHSSRFYYPNSTGTEVKKKKKEEKVTHRFSNWICLHLNVRSRWDDLFGPIGKTWRTMCREWE